MNFWKGWSLWKYKRLVKENHCKKFSKILIKSISRALPKLKCNKNKFIINENFIFGLWELDMKTNLLLPLWKMIENFFKKIIDNITSYHKPKKMFLKELGQL
jgi:hypothetical protein